MSVTNGKIVIYIFNLNLSFLVRYILEKEEKICSVKTVSTDFFDCFSPHLVDILLYRYVIF